MPVRTFSVLRLFLVITADHGIPATRAQTSFQGKSLGSQNSLHILSLGCFWLERRKSKYQLLFSSFLFSDLSYSALLYSCPRPFCSRQSLKGSYSSLGFDLLRWVLLLWGSYQYGCGEGGNFIDKGNSIQVVCVYNCNLIWETCSYFKCKSIKNI